MDTPDPEDPAPAIEVQIHRHVGIAIVTLRGEHDLSTEAGVGEALSRASAQEVVLVDLSECTFADSTVLKSLVGAKSEIEQRGGRIELVIPPEASAVRRVVELTRLDESIRVHEQRAGFGPASGGGAA